MVSHRRRHDGAARAGFALSVAALVAAVFLACADHQSHPLTSGVSALAAIACLASAIGCTAYLRGGRR